MKKITDKLKDGKLLVSDGALGTELIDRGLKAGECPELWNFSNRNIIFDVAKKYIEVGAELIETNSFGANKFKLKHYGLDDRVAELNITAAEIAREAAGKNIHVLGAIGPTGKLLIMGEVTKNDLYDCFSQQAMALEKGGADSILIETMSDIEEAKIAIKAAKDNTKCEIICTMTFEKGADGNFHTMMGISPTDMVSQLSDSGLDILGANCGRGIEEIIEIVKEIKKANRESFVVANFNAGVPVYSSGKIIYPDTAKVISGFIPKLIESGANVIGGCCGTTPGHIKTIVEIIKNYDKQ